MTIRDFLRAGAFGTLCLTSLLSAQRGEHWTTMPLPANVISGPNFVGNMVSLQTPTAFWLYSGLTKKWVVLPVTNPSPLFQANDYCIVKDGNTVHAFSAFYGRIDSITTSGSPTIQSGPPSSSWVTLVADGTTAWAYGAFHSKFERIQLSQPGPQMLANRLSGLLRDGSTVYGVSAHHGTFVPVAADTSATLAIVEEAEVATANSPGVFRAFSVQQNTWVVQAVPVSSSSLQQAEFAMVWSGNQAWAVSGLSGVLDTYVASNPITNVSNSDGVAAFFDGTDVVCYGSGRGRFAKLPASPSATFSLDYHFVIVVEPTSATPFSALTGTFGSPVSGSFSVRSNDAIAYLDGGSVAYAYSPLTNAFTLAPAVSPTNVELVRDSVTLVHAAGYTSLSARYGTWVSQTVQQPGNYTAAATGSTFLAIDGSTLHVFDAKLNRWASVTGAGPMSVQTARHTAIAHDGQTAYAFGQPSGEWRTQPLTANPSLFRVSSSVGIVVHGTQISTFGVQGSFCFRGRYPGFTQTVNLGNTLTLHQYAEQGSIAFLFAGMQPARLDLGPVLGRLYLDPAGLVSLGLSRTIGYEGYGEFSIPLPKDPTLVGGQVHLQDLVVPPAGPASSWLTTSVALVLY